MKIIMVLTSHDQLGNTGRKTGFAPGKVNLYVGKTRGEIQHTRSGSSGPAEGFDPRALEMA